MNMSILGVSRELLATLISIVRIARHSKLTRWPTRQVHRKCCLVLGNGPSLAADLKGGVDLQFFDVFCVNRFAESDLYTQLRPQYYVLADPAFWEDGAASELLEMRDRLYKSIRENTSWGMQLFVPMKAVAFFEREFGPHDKIQVLGFNNVDVRGRAQMVHRLFDLGFGCPAAQNVLIPSIYIAIRSGYESVVCLGADHSWHEDIVLDEKNRVCLRDKHFYDTNAELKPWGMGGNDGKLFSMDAAFFALGKMFEGYWRLKHYAEYKGVKIYNGSSKTYIDAFERIDIKDVQAHGPKLK